MSVNYGYDAPGMSPFGPPPRLCDGGCNRFPTAWLPRCEHCYCHPAPIAIDHLACCKCGDKMHEKFIAQSVE